MRYGSETRGGKFHPAEFVPPPRHLRVLRIGRPEPFLSSSVMMMLLCSVMMRVFVDPLLSAAAVVSVFGGHARSSARSSVVRK